MTLSRNRSTLFNTVSCKSLSKDRGLARLGDSITNLVLSFAVSLVLGHPEGRRAPDKVLSQALTEAGLRHMAPKRAGIDELGDIAESLIASAWLNNTINIEDAASTIASEFKEEDIGDRKKENLSAIRGFKKLLQEVMKQMNTYFIDSGRKT
nr:ribonuclease III family protein [Candidatus Njordarchaeum guaymaensis]